MSNKEIDLIENIKVDIRFAQNQLSYAKSKVSPFDITDPDGVSDNTLSWFESLGSIRKKKSAKFDVTFDVDQCAQPEQRIFAFASVGGCDLEVACPVVSYQSSTFLAPLEVKSDYPVLTL